VFINNRGREGGRERERVSYIQHEYFEIVCRLRGCTVYYVWEARVFMIPPKNSMIYERLYV
jgi:hypothetical protein